MKEDELLWTGSEADYEWLVSSTHSLSDLLEVCPELVVGRYVAVTAFDGGALILSDAEQTRGWKSELGIAYSPRVVDAENLPYDNCYDEWYVFSHPTNIGRLAEQGANVFVPPLNDDIVFQFVNYHLGLHYEPQRDIARLFWRQMDRIKPDVYLADTQNFVTMVSKDLGLFEKVLSMLE